MDTVLLDNKTIRITSFIYCDDVIIIEPGLVVIDLDETALTEIERLAAVVVENGLYRVERFDYSPRWFEYSEDEEGNEIPGTEIRTDCDIISVFDDEVQFTSVPKHSDSEIRSERITIADLRRLLR